MNLSFESVIPWSFGSPPDPLPPPPKREGEPEPETPPSPDPERRPDDVPPEDPGKPS